MQRRGSGADSADSNDEGQVATLHEEHDRLTRY